MDPDREMKLVYGYLPEIDFEVYKAWRSGLKRRLAIVLESYRADNVDTFFDCELLIGLLSEIFSRFEYDAVSLAPDDEGSKPLDSLESLRQRYARMEEWEREPFYYGHLSKNGRPVLWMNAELYARCGGPEPYHDSYTLSLYAEVFDPAIYTPLCQSVCDRLGAGLVAVINGESEPYVSVWTKLGCALGL